MIKSSTIILIRNLILWPKVNPPSPNKGLYETTLTNRTGKKLQTDYESPIHFHIVILFISLTDSNLIREIDTKMFGDLKKLNFTVRIHHFPNGEIWNGFKFLKVFEGKNFQTFTKIFTLVNCREGEIN